MDVDARVEAWASLQLIKGLTARALFLLLQSLGGPAEVRAASLATLSRFASADIAEAIRRGPDPHELERLLGWLSLPGHSLFAWDDADYPRRCSRLPIRLRRSATSAGAIC